MSHPPTISDKKYENDKDARKEKKPESILCRVKYTNTLRDLPFEPKFLAYPFNTNRFIQYNNTSLERNHKHELLTERDGGLNIELVDPYVFHLDPTIPLHPVDEKLLEDDLTSNLDKTRSRYHNASISWLKKTEYLASDVYNKFAKTDNTEARIGQNKLRDMMNATNLYRDRQSQIDAIEKTFLDASAPIEKHYSKEGVYAIEVLPVLPDFKNWKYSSAQVIFDAPPVPQDKENDESDACQAMIRGMVDDTGDEFVAYFLPSTDKRKRKLGEPEGESHEYTLTREYKWKFKSKIASNFEENFFFVIGSDGVFYNELESRVRLNKRRKVNTAAFGGSGLSAPSLAGRASRPTRLIVSQRDCTDDEYRQQASRLSQLELAEEDDEEEEGEEEEEEEGAQNDEEEDGLETEKVNSEADDDEGDAGEEDKIKKISHKSVAKPKKRDAEMEDDETDAGHESDTEDLSVIKPLMKRSNVLSSSSSDISSDLDDKPV